MNTNLVRSSLVLALGLAVACGEDTTTPEPSAPAVAAQSGNGQSAAAGQAVANPLVVRVTRDGSAASGISVSWAVTAGGGSVNPTTSSTDSNGDASTVLTLGPNAGANTVEASVSGATGSPVQFSATGTGPPPAQANVSVGDNFFDPTSATVAAGGQVTWTWTGSVGHNVTFPTGTNSATQSSGMFSRSFPAVGSFQYQCTIHSGMNGTVVVQ